MKSIMASVSPHLCGKITSGKCKILVRKSAPKEVPFKAYIYCTRITDKKHCSDEFDIGIWKGNEHVIGEFICDKVEEFHEWELSPQGKFAEFEEERLEKFLTAACLSRDEVFLYRENLPYYKPLYGWHISDLKIYDSPRELDEFKTPPCDTPEKACATCKYRVVINTPDMYEVDCFVANGRRITRPPMSWMYVEEI